MPRVIDHALYKEEILTKCFDLFARRGYASLTMRELAKELGISTGSLYHYFPSKEDIFGEMIAWLSNRDVQRVVSQIPPDAPLETRLKILIQFVTLQEADFLRLLLLVLDYKRARPEEGEAAVRAVLEIYKVAIREQLGGDPTLSDFIFNSMMGLIAGRYLDDGVDFEAQMQLIGTAVIAMLGARETAAT